MALWYRSDRLALRATLRLLAVGLLLAGLAACQSPLDPDTPRRRIVTEVVPPTDSSVYHHWLPAEITFTSASNGTQWPHKRDSAWAFVDTTHGKTELRLMYAGTKLPPYTGQDKFVHSFLLADTLVANAVAHNLTGHPSTGTGVLLRIALGKDSITAMPVETLLGGDSVSGTSATLTLYRPNKERSVRGSFVASAQKYRTAIEGTVVISW